MSVRTANLVNWTANPDGDSAGGTGTDQTPTPARGFFPFGVMATFRGAALCTFAFIGIEMLMRSKRDTMRSVSFIGMLSFAMILLSLLGCTTVLTLMWPHYLMVCVCVVCALLHDMHSCCRFGVGMLAPDNTDAYVYNAPST